MYLDRDCREETTPSHLLHPSETPQIIQKYHLESLIHPLTPASHPIFLNGGVLLRHDLFLLDWSLVSDPGCRFENFMAVQLKTWCEFITDGGWCHMELHYVRDKQKREVDFLVVKDGKPFFLVEAKKTKGELDKNLEFFSKVLGNITAFQVTEEPGIFRKHKPQIWSVSANRFFNLLWIEKA